MPIPDHLVEEIRLRADILEIIGEHTKLKRTGRTWRGPCPLHGGEGPNFSVDPQKGFYKCFTCGEGGTVYTFLMKHLGMTYPDAIRLVAGRVGVDIPDPREEKREEDPHRPLYDITHFAADWFRRQLWETDGGKTAVAYLENRGITRETAERFGLGWAPESWDAFGDAARKHGIPTQLLLELGLAKERKSGGDPYDAFRARVIFPIEDLGGRVLGFGGRIIAPADERTPKYLNSPESPIYHKGRTLYGLGWSRGAIRKEEVALVVEGYMDYVSLASHGIGHAVAPLGTAMTPEQAALIRNYAPRAILLYDSDKAGLKATFRNGDELLRAGMEVLVATLPKGEDPDSLVRAKGAAALRKYLDDAIDVLERKIQLLERKGDFATISGTRRAVDRLLPTIRAAADEVTRGVYLSRLSEKTGVSVATLEKEVAELAPPPPPPSRSGSPPSQSGPPPRPEDAWPREEWQTQEWPTRREPWQRRPGEERRQDGGRQGRRWRDREEERPSIWSGTRGTSSPEEIVRMGAEKNLLLLMLHNEDYIDRVMEWVGPPEYGDPDFRRIYKWLLDTQHARDPEGRWLAECPDDLAPLVEHLRDDLQHHDWSAVDVFFADNVDKIRARSLEREARELKQKASAGDEMSADVLAGLQHVFTNKRQNKDLKVKPGVLDPNDPTLNRHRRRDA